MKANREKEAKLKHEYLLSILDYDPETGVFKWKVMMSTRAMPGSIAGTINAQGYIQIVIKNTIYRAHRLAWFYVYKKWPKDIIDHIDRNTQNNAISNLRDVNLSTNGLNCKITHRNMSGTKGVSYNERSKRWRADIKIEGKAIYLGSFIDYEFAVKARKDAEIKYGIICG